MNTLDLKDVVLLAADRMPFLPAAFQRTLSLFARKGDEVSVAELAGVVEQDVVMAGNLLAIANSALYGRSSAVCSVRQAIARVGIHKTRNALLGLSIFRSFRGVKLPKNWSSARFSAHSLASAIFSDLIVQEVQTNDAEWAFLAGLLHDIGLLLIATALPDQSLCMADALSDFQVAARERELFGFSHFEVGVDLLARWNCPASVQEASLFCQTNAFECHTSMSLGMVVKNASLLADASGFSVFGSNEDQTFVPELLDALKIQKPATFIEVFQTEYNGFQTGVGSGGVTVR
jgi:HD-like signal output (HDOD) protein